MQFEDKERETDKKLLTGAKLERAEGGLDAFEKILFRYEKLIYNIAFRYFSNADDAISAAQESVIKIYDGLCRNDLSETFSLKIWICKVTANTCLKCRSDKSKALLTSAKAAAIACERSQKIIEALHKLSGSHRMIIILRDIQGLSYAELAGALNIRESKVKSRLSKARLELVTKLSKGSAYLNAESFNSRR